jgi:hypothetical protein
MKLLLLEESFCGAITGGDTATCLGVCRPCTISTHQHTNLFPWQKKLHFESDYWRIYYEENGELN